MQQQKTEWGDRVPQLETKSKWYFIAKFYVIIVFLCHGFVVVARVWRCKSAKVREYKYLYLHSIKYTVTWVQFFIITWLLIRGIFVFRSRRPEECCVSSFGFRATTTPPVHMWVQWVTDRHQHLHNCSSTLISICDQPPRIYYLLSRCRRAWNYMRANL